jgi:hypothetical protein
MRATSGRRWQLGQPAGASRRRAEASRRPLTVSESAYRVENQTWNSSSWKLESPWLTSAVPAAQHAAVGDWRSPSPGPCHYFLAASSKAAGPAAAAKREWNQELSQPTI